MKKLFCALGLVVLLATSSFGAAQAAKIVYSSTGDEVVDSQYTGGWEVIDSLIIIRAGDSSIAIIRFSGWASIDAGDALYLGWGSDSANVVSASNTKAHSNLDTTYIAAPKAMKAGKLYLPFYTEYISKVTAANTDTFYINAAVIGNTNIEKVELYDTYLECVITAP